MSKTQRASYFRLMGLVACIVSVAMIVGLVITIVNQFIDKAAAWPIIANFLNILAVLGVGLGLTNLFYSHANVLDECL
ncbi:MAG: hypothetical protein MJ227_04690 [Bacilli bacterium]|nr:hypothetical protein [Bacilli bacterium]